MSTAFRSKRYPDLNKLEAELESAREEKLRAKKKRKLADMSAVSDGDYDSDVGSVASDGKGDKSAKAKKARPSTPATNGEEKKAPKKAKKGRGGTGDDQEEEQEDCSATKCLRPTGKEVSCNFHKCGPLAVSFSTHLFDQGRN